MMALDGPARIGIFLPNLAGGGAEQVMLTLANAFANEKILVDLVLASATGDFLAEVDPRIRIVDLGRRRVSTSLFRLSAYLRRESPLVLLTALSHANVVALLAKRLAGGTTRVVISERTSFASIRHHNRGLKDKILRTFMRLTYRQADAITVVSEPIVSELASAIGLDRERIHYVPNPIVSDRINSKAQEPPAHPWLRASAGSPVILGVGRLSQEKGFEVLVRAFARVVESRTARLVILGEGPQRPELERLVQALGLSDRVSLPGFERNPYAAMKRAALFVLPSYFEGMPGALIQAMACGTPVVSTDCRTGPRAVLEDGRWGRLVPVGDVDAMAEAIVAALEDSVHPPVAERAAHFDERRSVAAYLEVMGLGRHQAIIGTGSGESGFEHPLAEAGEDSSHE